MTNDESTADKTDDGFEAVFSPAFDVSLEDVVELLTRIGVSFVGAVGRKRFNNLSSSLQAQFIVKSN